MEVREVHVVGGCDWVDAAEICRLCRLDLEVMIELAELGLVSLRAAPPGQWQVPVAALPRLAAAGRLMRDLGVNVSGAALALELLDAQRELERQIRCLQALAQ